MSHHPGAPIGRSAAGRHRRPRPRRIVGLDEPGLVGPASDPRTAAPARDPDADDDAPDGLSLNPRERALIAPELAAFAGALTSTARQGYVALLEAVERGSVAGASLEQLGAFLELGLSTGRFRTRLGAHAEEAIRRLFERTPRGAALAASAAEVTKALERLAGQTLTDLRLSLVRPGTYRLLLETEHYRISLGLAPAGAHVESVELQL
jgi:hypothetical protein